MVKSKFNLSRFVNVFLVLFGAIIILIFIFKIFNKIFLRGFRSGDSIILIFFLFIIYFAIIHLSGIKYIVINSNRKKLKYFSILYPLGRKIDLESYIGLLQITETGTSGKYKVLYLIDSHKVTRFKIVGLYYSNIEEIVKEISLPLIKQDISTKQYLKLLFTGKLTIS
ncbi:hypothetical protein [Chryseobacterium flavum]|uniref:hypothetical protein n=1 Tax=Chryseobacterium flavum TaxID=415851 RepID=UPI0028AABFE8|nr:hypothetical protein [Chryseobacterium flavum]